jgi:acetyltransferase-like isoleucine patch superfamily enzyme
MMNIFNHPQFSEDSNGYLVSNTRIDTLIPNAIEIGENLISAVGSWILAHDSSLINHIDKVAVRKTVIGKNVFIGLNAIVMPGVTVGDGAIIGTGSIVTKDVEPYTVVVGNPAKLICTVDEYIIRVKNKATLIDPVKGRPMIEDLRAFRRDWLNTNNQESK